MKILICVDDTDNIDEGSTGEIASLIAEAIIEQGWGTTLPITRHQLLIHPDIPYTSHNSSMCLASEIKEEYLGNVIANSIDLLMTHQAAGSDPGLCVVVIDKLSQPEKLMEFGRRAKQTVITKQAAYDLARELDIHLSEHGGTGQGIIGALAGAGLRLTGHDGRVKGKLKVHAADMVLSIAELINQTQVDLVKSLDGTVPPGYALVKLEDKIKAVFLEGKSVILVRPTHEEDIPWELCPNSVLKNY